MARLGVRSLRRATLVSGALDLAVASLGAVLVALALRRCGWREKAPATAAAAMAAVKIASMVWAGIAQRAAAAAIARRFSADPLLSEDDAFRRMRKVILILVFSSSIVLGMFLLRSRFDALQMLPSHHALVSTIMPSSHDKEINNITILLEPS